MSDPDTPSTHGNSDEFREHQRVIARIVDDWRRGQIDVSQKRVAIAAENMRYYGQPIKSPNTGEPLGKAPRRGDPSIAVLSDATGIIFEAAAAALEARRKANVRAANCDSVEEARRIRADGLASYHAIMDAAQPGRVPERAAPPPEPPMPDESAEVQETMDW